MANIAVGSSWKTKAQFIADTCIVTAVLGEDIHYSTPSADYVAVAHKFLGTWEPRIAAVVYKTTTTANGILEAAAGHMQDRAATYDKPEGERSMGATVQAFQAVTGHTLTEEQGWLFMQLLKAVRSQQGAYRADSYEDGAAYVALAGEAAARART